MELFVGRGIAASVFGGFKGKTQLPSFAKECMEGVSLLNPTLSFKSMLRIVTNDMIHFGDLCWIISQKGRISTTYY